MADFDCMTLQNFQLWSEAALKSFLGLRQKSTEGSFDELAARAFIAWEEKLPVRPEAEHAERKLLEEYSKKLTVDGEVLPDPMVLADGWVSEVIARSLWPPTYVTDIATYLQHASSDELVNAVLNEYKLGKAYRYFSCGWIKDILYHPVRPSSPVCLLKARVLPSMSVSAPAYCVWVAIQKSLPGVMGGKIFEAYCNCTAGMLGCCNHIASLLFKLEHNSVTGGNLTSNISCTSLPCKWNTPHSKVTAVPVDSVPWTKTHYTKPTPASANDEKLNFLPCGEEKLQNLNDKESIRDKICETASRCAPNSRFCQLMFKTRPKASASIPCPPTLIEMANQCKAKTQEAATCMEKMTENMKLTKEACDSLKEATTSQHHCSAWREQRKGRITSSVFHRVASRARSLKSDPNKDSRSVVAQVMGYSDNITTAAMKHGISCEPHAKCAYIEIMKKSHRKFSACNSGIAVIPESSYISASADLEVKCACCGDGLCEIKCPASIKGEKPTVDNLPFLESSEGVVQMKKSHSYYSQIQGQMGVHGRKYSDFFIFTFHGNILLRVQFDESFWENMKQVLCWFWNQYILPELFTGEVKKRLSLCNRTDEGNLAAQPLASCSTGPNVTSEQGHFQPSATLAKRKRTHHVAVHLCCVCGRVCVDDPVCDLEESIQCDMCNMWCHFKCCSINSGSVDHTEEDWLCPKCVCEL